MEPFSPADMAGIKVHDRLLSINNVPVMKVAHSVVVEALQSAGCDVAIKIERYKHANDLVNQVIFFSISSISLFSRYYAEACNEWRDPSLRLSAEQHSSENTSQRWRAVGDSVSDLSGPGIAP